VDALGSEALAVIYGALTGRLMAWLGGVCRSWAWAGPLPGRFRRDVGTLLIVGHRPGGNGGGIPGRHARWPRHQGPQPGENSGALPPVVVNPSAAGGMSS